MDFQIQILGRRLAIKSMPPLTPVSGRGGWFPWVIRESYPGAWQQNVDVSPVTVLTYFAVFACVTLIASDIGKLSLRLVIEDSNGIWSETDNPAFSPVLRKPNRYQTINKFVEQWITSKLVHGNAYVLKERDNRNVVTVLYVLDPLRVRPLVAPDGSVYYYVTKNIWDPIPPESYDRAALNNEGSLTIPASEIIHDAMVTMFHPLIGVSPITACGLAAAQGLKIQATSTKFFGNGSQPGGVLTAPGAISDETAARLKEYWDNNFGGDNVGKVAVVGDGLKYEAASVNAVDAQLIEQLHWTAENVCSCYHVQPYMIGVGAPPPYANVEPLLQQYFSQCIQSLLVNFEACLDDGLGLLYPINGTQYGTEFDIGDLIWMDTATKTKAATDSIAGSAMSPNEARQIYLGLGPTTGGASVLSQQQNYSLAALAKRDAADPFAKPPAPAPPADVTPPADLAMKDLAALVRRKASERWNHAA